jgi:hypothetical protein
MKQMLVLTAIVFCAACGSAGKRRYNLGEATIAVSLSGCSL